MMGVEELKAWVAFNAAPHVGPARFHQMLRAFGGLRQALEGSLEEFQKRMPLLQGATAREMLAGAKAFDAGAELAAAEADGISVLTLRSLEYPQGLIASPGAPPVVYVKGKLPLSRMLGVVGTRTPTEYGKAMARRLSLDLARSGIAIVSGLARGVDGESHKASLEAGAPTVAVLGSGLKEIYPREHGGLAADIASKGGALVSQFPLFARPERWRFPMRNSVLAGLCSGVLVVEGAEDSGSLITAKEALDFGRDVFAVPGPADSELSRGANRLIQQGAKLVLDAVDVLEEYPEFHGALKKREAAPAQESRPRLAEAALSGEESALVALVKESGRLPLAMLVEKAGMNAGQVGAQLTMLEIKGVLRQLPGSLVEAV